jgi:hypothetical protein
MFQDSPLPLDKWLVAIWLLANSRNGCSSCELARTLGIKQQSAWHVFHRLRRAVKPAHQSRMQGIVESDDTVIGGLLENMHAHKRRAKRKQPNHGGKACVQVLLQRGGHARAYVIPRPNRKHLQANVRQHVSEDAWLMTDSAMAYTKMNDYCMHQWVNHMETYVRGAVHINGAENFFSLLRRGLHGTYVAVDPAHLEAYVDEQAYRFNWRKDSDWQRFHQMLSRCMGKQLTYSELTGGKVR